VSSPVEKINPTEPIAKSQLGFNNLLKPIAKSQLSPYKADAVIAQYDFLIDPKYIKWFYKQLYRLGVPRFIELAGRAAEGRDPKRLFSKLLKEAR
jgi:hypothetical protein